VIAVSVAFLFVLMFLLHHGMMDGSYWRSFFLFLHVLGGIMWIGLLYYFNFVQIPTMPKVPAELKPGVTKYIAPAALFWFRYAALATVILGLLIIELRQGGDSGRALGLQEPYRVLGVGMWLGLIMAANVWFVIWPNQKKALGIVTVDDASKAKAASLAMMASRTNLILSLPMLYCMIMGAHRPM
jgi:uncharacterized membrane protein